MLDNCCYNKIKLMHDVSSLIWFIKQHALADAQKENDNACQDFLKNLEKDLCEHLHTLKHMVCEQEKECQECK